MTIMRTAALGVLLPLAAAVEAPRTPNGASATANAVSALAQDSAKKTTAKKTTKSAKAKTTAKSTSKTTARATASGKGTASSATAPHPSATGAANAAPNSAAAGAASGGGSVKVNRFMSYDASGKTVSLEVIAALTSQQGGFNFNGGSNGSQTVTVPQGWTVRMHVKNVDAIPHSAIIIADQRPLPNAPETPAIPRAYTSHVSDGLAPQNGADDVEFRASKPGTFLIYCGVPGHGPSGMYIKLVVSPTATVPAYAM